jgi:hypothetical protein
MSNSRGVASRNAPVGAAAGLGGIVLPTIGLLVLPIWRFPGTSASGADIADFVAGHQTALQVVMVLNTVGVSLWMVFGTFVWQSMRGLSGRDSVLPGCFGAGLIGFVTLLLAGFVAFDVLVYRGGGGSAEARVLYDLTFGLLAMSGMPTAIALTAYAIGVHRRGVLPRHTGYLATAAAVAHVALLLSFVCSHGFFSLEGQGIVAVPAVLWAWIVATAIAMLRRPVQEAHRC